MARGESCGATAQGDSHALSEFVALDNVRRDTIATGGHREEGTSVDRDDRR